MKTNRKENSVKETTPGFQLHNTPIISSDEDLPYRRPLGADLPKGFYGTGNLFLTALAPRRLFSYWDIDIRRHPGGPTYLRVFQNDTYERDIEVAFEGGNYYFDVANSATNYRVEIGVLRGEEWISLGQSTSVFTPAESLSTETDFAVARVGIDEDLSRGDYRLAVLPVSVLQVLSPEAASLISSRASQADASLFSMLEEALGSGWFASWASASALSGEALSSWNKKLALQLESFLSSESGASWLLRFEALLAESSFLGSSALGVKTSASNLSSGGLSSGGLSSGGVLSGGLSSEGFIRGGESSEEFSLSSGIFALSSWLSGIVQTFSSAGLSSWQRAEQLSSFSFGESVSSGSLSSAWSGSHLASWASGEGSSLSSPAGGGSSHMFSGVGLSSFGNIYSARKASFAGRAASLEEDGTLHFFDVLPDEEFEIPVVATSSDFETRYATLKFKARGARGKILQAEGTRA
ncbi:MAG: DUF4912 domain-containing protein [Chthoniobacterales bacterium]